MDTVRDNLFVRAMGEGNEASVAKRLLLENLERNRIHPTELTLFQKGGEGKFAQAQRLLGMMDTRLAEQKKIVRFLLTKVDPLVARQAHKAGLIDYGGYEFDEEVEKRLGGLHKGWEKHVAEHLYVSVTQIRRWREGMDEVPDDVLDALRSLRKMPIKVGDKAAAAAEAEAVKRRPAKESYNWSDFRDVEIEAAKRFLKGVKAADLASFVTGRTGIPINDNQINQRFYNSPPPSGLASCAARESGPLTWDEAWLLASTIQKKAWRTKLAEILEIDKTIAPPYDLNRFATPEAIQRLRDTYAATKSASLNPPMSKSAADLEAAIRFAGREGLTRVQMGRMNLQRRRTPELERQKRVFSVGDRLIHAAFAEHYPVDAKLAGIEAPAQEAIVIPMDRKKGGAQS